MNDGLPPQREHHRPRVTIRSLLTLTLLIAVGPGWLRTAQQADPWRYQTYRFSPPTHDARTRFPKNFDPPATGWKLAR